MASLLEKRLLFVTGKGGVGKTTVATAIALAAAARGKRTILCEVSQEERMAHVFRRDGVGYSEAHLGDNLYGISIDPHQALAEYLADQIGSERLTGLLFQNRLFEYFAAAAPGLRELTTIGKVWELAQPQRRDPSATPYDLVVVDAPASGHGLAMLRTPRTYGEVARVGPVRRQAGHIVNFLGNSANTAVVAVALAQEMAVSETLELCDEAAEQGTPAEAVIVNAVLPERFSAADAQAIATAAENNGSQRVADATRSALEEYRRSRSQRGQLRRLRRDIDRTITLPFIWAPRLSLDDLNRLAAELDRKL